MDTLCSETFRRRFPRPTELQANGVNVRRGISRSIAAARDLAAIAYAMTLMVKRLPGAVRLQTKVPDSFDLAPAAARISNTCKCYGTACRQGQAVRHGDYNEEP